MADSSKTAATVEALGALATAQLGPLGGLIVQLGAPAAMAIIARHRAKPAHELTEAEIRLTASELLAKSPTFEEMVRMVEKGQQLANDEGDGDDADDGA
jgi:hypothetical protein